MSNKFSEELKRFSRCSNTEQLLCGAPARMDFSYRTAILTAPKPLQDKALSKGGEGAKRKPYTAFRPLHNTFDTS